MIRQLAHICIHTDDLEKTERYYKEALGLDRGFDFVRNGKPFGFYLKMGSNTFIEVFEGNPGAVGNINHLAIEVEDIDNLIRNYREKGFEIGEKKLGADHSWQVWATDPNGVRLEFQQYTEKSLQLRGGTCVVDW